MNEDDVDMVVAPTEQTRVPYVKRITSLLALYEMHDTMERKILRLQRTFTDRELDVIEAHAHETPEQIAERLRGNA